MLILSLGPIVAIAILTSIALVLFLAGLYLVEARVLRGQIFGLFWAIVTILPVFAGVPLVFLRGA